MQDGLFFRVLRRFNMVLCTLIALALLALLGATGWRAYKHDRFAGILSRDSGSFSATRNESPVQYKYEVALESFDAPAQPNRPAVYGLYVYNRVSGDGSYYPPPVATNVMEVNLETGAGTWLFKGTDRAILIREAIREGELPDSAATDNRKIVGLVMWVVEKDTNKDGDYNYGDAMTIYAWHLGEKAPAKLLTIDSAIGSGQLSATRYNIIFKKGGKRVSVIYALPSFKQVSEAEIPDPPK